MYGADFKANPDEIRKARELSPANVTEALFTDEEAAALIEEWFTAKLSKLLSADAGTYSHSLESVFDKLNKKILTRSQEILDAQAKGERADKAIEDVESVASVLRDFIREFCRAYIEEAPTPARKDLYPYSYGNYLRSSIMYFTNDEESRQRALQLAMTASSVPSDEDEFIFGQRYVIRQLRMSELYSEKGDVIKRMKRILGGITIENVAHKERAIDNYYYGWYNVERFGWKMKDGKRREPYKPFQHALKKAKKKFHIGKSIVFIDVTLHDE